MTDLIIRPLADAFLQVGVWVALMLLVFGYAQWRSHGRVVRFLAAHRGAGPLIGAVMGVTPGCGGAIVMMPLYVRGTVSYGTVVATLVATMGDSSWVIIAADPRTAAAVHALLLAAGIVSGYLVDALRLAPRATGQLAAAAIGGGSIGGGSTVGSAEAIPALRSQPRVTPAGQSPMPLFWLLVGVGLVVSVLVVFQLVEEQALTRAAGGVNPYLAVGALGALTSAAIFAGGRTVVRDDTLDTVCEKRTSLPALLHHNARETAFVTVWVAVAYLGYTWIVTLTGMDLSGLRSIGFVGVVAGALVGLIPGCAPQIVLTGLYVQGALPFPTLLANALSQDGDALFPLLAMETRSALLASVLTLLPALVGGGIALLVSG